MFQQIQFIQEKLKSVSDSRIQYRVLGLTDKRQIMQLYKAYVGEITNPNSFFKTEFLYVPSEQEIITNICANTSCYIGALNNGRLVSVLKLQNMEITPEKPTTPFFVPPRKEGLNGCFYGISGMLTAPDFRGKGIVAPMITQVLNVLRENGATGIYADCDYRNISSFNTLSSFLNFIGFTDGRNGLAGEQTLYVTFYNSLQNTSASLPEKALSVYKETPEKAYITLQRFMAGLGMNAYTDVTVFLDDKRFNRVYVLNEDNKIKLQKIANREKQPWELGTCVVRKEERKFPKQQGGRQYAC